MPILDQEQTAAVGTFMPDAFVYQSPDGWTLATQGKDEQVGICMHPDLHFIRLTTKRPWFVFPAELAGLVLARARELQSRHQEEVEKGYEAMAADTEREAEALEWSEGLIGDGFEPYEG